MTTKSVEIDIEVSLPEFGDDELAEELRSRGFFVATELRFSLIDVRNAFQNGNEAEAIRITKGLICDEFGIVL